MNTVNWFELPVVDMPRAVAFYQQLLAVELKLADGPRPMAIFAYTQPGVSGALVKDQRKPSMDGAIVYLKADGKLDACLERVGTAGGEVVVGKTDIGPNGHFALVRDTEGNLVGLHAA